MLLSEKMPVALNCCMVPMAIVGLAGVTEMETSAAPVTLSTVDPEMFPKVAVIVVFPMPSEVAIPLEPVELLIVATDVPDDHVTDVVRFCVLLSEKMPVAVNCCLVPTAILGLVGVTEMDTRVAGVTVRMVEAYMFPDTDEAVMLVVPTAAAVALPSDPGTLLIAATEVEEELHMTDAVISCLLLSENMPVAVNC